MKVIRHVQRLLTQGRTSKELLELGFSQCAITRARRQLRKQRAAERASNSTQGNKSTSHRRVQSTSAQVKIDIGQLEDAVDILELWAYILQLTHCLEGFACPQCVDGHLCWQEWEDGDGRDGGYVCDVCGYQPPTLPESRTLWQEDSDQ